MNAPRHELSEVNSYGGERWNDPAVFRPTLAGSNIEPELGIRIWDTVGKDQQMITGRETFPLPDRLEPELERVRAYWESLKRGENRIPFWDDAKFSMLAQMCRDVMMIKVFQDPARFRFDLAAEDLTQRYGAPIAGKFTDEIDLHAPVDGLTDQCRATVKRGAPTWFRHAAADGAGYSRLVLPLWGNGYIEMLIGAASFGP
jgi:hypothetical protein